MVRKGSILGETLEQGGSIVGQTGKQVVKLPSDLAKTAAGQTGAAPASSDQNAPVDTAETKKQREEFVKGLYGISDKKGAQGQAAAKSPQSPKPAQQKSPEELQKLAGLRQKLHQETYYQPLVNPSKPQEERPAEKVEREKQEELVELQEKKKEEPPPLPSSARPGTVEKKTGISG